MYGVCTQLHLAAIGIDASRVFILLTLLDYLAIRRRTLHKTPIDGSISRPRLLVFMLNLVGRLLSKAYTFFVH
jgi:hypothetical protein